MRNSHQQGGGELVKERSMQGIDVKILTHDLAPKLLHINSIPKFLYGTYVNASEFRILFLKIFLGKPNMLRISKAIL